MRDPTTKYIDTEKENIEVVDFSKGKLLALAGGKGPPGSNWLEKLPEGSAFLTKKGMEPILMEWHIDRWSEEKRAVLLSMTMPDGQHLQQWFDPVEFCKLQNEFQVLREGSLESE